MQADRDSSDRGETESGATAELQHLLGADDLSTLADLADELDPRPLTPLAAPGLATAIGELAGGDTETQVNVSGDEVDRVAVVTDDFTVRVLMLTSDWKWRGPYTPDDLEAWLTDRGYTPASEVTDS